MLHRGTCKASLRKLVVGALRLLSVELARPISKQSFDRKLGADQYIDRVSPRFYVYKFTTNITSKYQANHQHINNSTTTKLYLKTSSPQPWSKSLSPVALEVWFSKRLYRSDVLNLLQMSHRRLLQLLSPRRSMKSSDLRGG